MCKDMGVGLFMHAITTLWMDQASEVVSSGEPFMVLSIHRFIKIKGGRKGEWGSLAPSFFS